MHTNTVDRGFETLIAMPEYNLFIVKDSGADAGSVGLLLKPSDNPIGANYMKALQDAGIPAIVLGVLRTCRQNTTDWLLPA